VIVDRQPYPPEDTAGCADPSSTYPTCISNGEIQSEVERLIRADGLPTAGKPNPELVANAPIYFVVLRADVNMCTPFAVQCADRNLQGYHDPSPLFDSRGNAVLYAAVAMDPLRRVSLPPPISGTCDPGRTGVAQELPRGCCFSIVPAVAEAVDGYVASGYRV
jgi:hypothetical protein